MALASLEDINLHLPDDKLAVDSARYVPLQQDSERIVRGYLAGRVTPIVLSTWTTPETTPGVIRSIVGRFIAAFYYRERYSEDGIGDPKYAQLKYDEAMALLQGVIDGKIILEEIGDTIGANSLTNLDFWPNNTTPGPYFTMDQVL